MTPVLMTQMIRMLDAVGVIRIYAIAQVNGQLQRRYHGFFNLQRGCVFPCFCCLETKIIVIVRYFGRIGKFNYAISEL